MRLLEVQGLNVQFYTEKSVINAVQDVSFHIDEGEIVGIVGESGSGKSSSMKAVMGLTGGEANVSCSRYVFEGQEERLPLIHPPRGMAMIFQDPLACLNPTLKIGKQVAEAVRARRHIGRKEAKERACELLEMTGIREPRQRMGQYPFELSGGMRQRAVIAMALACEPKLIIADEPTTALDVIVQGQILVLLKKIAEETKTAILLVSHDLGVIASLCERMYVMQSGRILEQGTVGQIFYTPATGYTRALLRDAERRDLEEAEEKKGETLLRLDKITKKDAVKEVSLTLQEGTMFGLIGESGCGKTTLAEIITGQRRQDGGRLYYRDVSVDDMKKKERRKYLQDIQMVFQDPYVSLNPKLTVGEALTEALYADRRHRLPICDRKDRAERMLELVGLNREDSRKYPEEFSGGQRQRIAIARALIKQPNLLICDEATAGLDIPVQNQILRLLKKIQERTKISGLFISHDLNVVQKICQRVGVMYLGHLVECGDTRELCRDPWHPYTKQLLESNPVPDPKRARRQRYTPSLERKEGNGKGCVYAAQCGYRMECCKREMPPAYRFGSREVACFLYSPEHRRGSREPVTAQV